MAAMDDKAIVAKVRQEVETARSSSTRISQESIWMQNIAYVCGADSVFWNFRTKAFQPVNNSAAFNKRRRFHNNKILPTLQNRLARLCKNPPRYDVRPESNDTDDKEAARLGLNILEGKWLDLGLNEKRIPLYMWAQETGHAYIKICWDTQLGNPMTDPMTGEFNYEGDIRADICSPFEIFPNPQAKNWDDVLRSWLTQCKVRSLDYFRSHYEKGAEVKEESTWLMSLQQENRIAGLNSRTPGSSTQQEQKNCAIEMIKYEARSMKYPNGRMIVCANGILLEDKELSCGEIPFAMFQDIVIAGRYYPEAITTLLRPLQDQLNETIRRRAEWTRMLLAGKYVVARGAGVKREQITNEQAEMVYYDPVPNAADGGRPMAMQVPMIPQWAYEEEKAILDMFNDSSGIGEISRGQIQASMPAIGMQLLQEQDQTRLAVTTEQHESQWARVGNLILKYVEKYYVLPRKLKMAGKNNTYMVKDVTGEMLHGNTDVIVIRGSTLPGSKAIKRQEIINSYQLGMLGPQGDPKTMDKLLSLMEFGDVQGIWEDYSLDTNQIKRGVEIMEHGEPVQVSEFDNHTLWLEELNRYRKNDKFDALAPEIQAVFMQNMEEHIKAMMHLSGADQAPPPADLTNPITPQEVMDHPNGPNAGPPPPQGPPQ